MATIAANAAMPDQQAEDAGLHDEREDGEDEGASRPQAPGLTRKQCARAAKDSAFAPSSRRPPAVASMKTAQSATSARAAALRSDREISPEPVCVFIKDARWAVQSLAAQYRSA
jgi:hypothetical protein